MKKTNRSILDSRKSILIIRLDGVGDFILWLDAAKALRAQYPANEYSVTLMINEDCAQLAEAALSFDKVWAINRNDFYRRLRYRYGVLRRLRASGFDTVVQANHSRQFYYHDTIVKFSVAPRKIGMSGDFSNLSRRQARRGDRYYTRLIPMSPDKGHELDINAAFVRGIGGVDFAAALPVLEGSFPELKDADKGYFVLFPGAGWDGRKWPAAWFHEIAYRIHLHTGWSGVICGGAKERQAAAMICDAADDIPMRNMAGETSLLELIGIIRNARLVVTNESSAVHIAAAVGAPSVCILGGGHFGRFLPYPERLREGGVKPIPVYHQMDCFGCDWKCEFDRQDGDAVPCIKNVSVEDVWDAVAMVIKRDPKSSGRRTPDAQYV